MNILRFAKGLTWLVSSDRHKRRRVRLEIAAIVAKMLGDFVVLEDTLVWVEDNAFRERFRALSPDNRFSKTRKWCCGSSRRVERP